MDTYSFLRHFADSWMLLLMTLLFVGIVVFAFRPGSRKVHDDAAQSIFRNDRGPAPDSAEAARRNFKEA